MKRHLLLAILVLLSHEITIQASIPPHPNLLKLIREGKIPTPYFMANKDALIKKGVNAPWKASSNMRSDFGPSKIPTGPTNALAILVQFSDNTSQVSATFFDDILFDQVMRSCDGMRNFLKADIIRNNGMVRI